MKTQIIKGTSMKTLVVSIQKGGVGKTTLSTHFGYFARSMNLKVLFIDHDTQGNSGSTLESHATKFFDTNEIYTKDLAELNVEQFSDPEVGAFVVFKGTKDLSQLTEEEHAIKIVEFMNAVEDYFDICIFDTPPTQGNLQNFPFVVANGIISPFELDNYSYSGFESLIDSIKEIQEINENVQFLGFVPNKVDLRSAFHKEQLKMVQSEFSDYLFGDNFYVPLRSKMQEACHYNVPVWEIDKNRTVSSQIKKLSKAILIELGVEL